MSEAVLESGAEAPGKQGVIDDWARDKQVFGMKMICCPKQDFPLKLRLK